MKVEYAQNLMEATRKLASSVSGCEFSSPVTHVYNPLIYARKSHELYLKKFANSSKRVVFLGMNPGPFGMAQTGVPFGEIELVRDWMGIETKVEKPAHMHPKRPVEGFACKRSEVSGRRLWGLFRDRFGMADDFFKNHYVSNYCPLLFLNERGSNVTPDKIKKAELIEIYKACDRFLIDLLVTLQPQYLVGVGNFAFRKGLDILSQMQTGQNLPHGQHTEVHSQVVKILHPSPASPAANKGWAEVACRQLQEAGVW